jgi:hypothetical protein
MWYKNSKQELSCHKHFMSALNIIISGTLNLVEIIFKTLLRSPPRPPAAAFGSKNQTLIFNTYVFLQVGPKVVLAALKAFTRIDGLIINHGTLSPVTRIADSNPEEWRSAFDVNFFSAVSFVCPPYPLSSI